MESPLTFAGNCIKLLEDCRGGDDETRTRDLCHDSLGTHVVSATYILAGAAKSLKGTVEPFPVGKFVGKTRAYFRRVTELFFSQEETYAAATTHATRFGSWA